GARDRARSRGARGTVADRGSLVGPVARAPRRAEPFPEEQRPERRGARDDEKTKRDRRVPRDRIDPPSSDRGERDGEDDTEAQEEQERGGGVKRRSCWEPRRGADGPHSGARQDPPATAAASQPRAQPPGVAVWMLRTQSRFGRGRRARSGAHALEDRLKPQAG